jgi:plasmid stabilization system protein ParE
MSDCRLSRAAFHDIDESVDYIAKDDSAAAEKVRDAIFDTCNRLNARPLLGHRRIDLTVLPLRFRTVRGRYLIAYRGEAAPIEVVRVFGPGRDVARLLR